MLRIKYFISTSVILAGLTLAIGCKSEEEEVTPTFEQQIAGEWQLNSLDATILLDGEDFTIYLAQLAESFGFVPEEVVIGLLLVEGQINQELLAQEPRLNLLPNRSFEFHRIDAESLIGSWQMAEDDQYLLLIDEAADTTTLYVEDFDEDEITLVLAENSANLFSIPAFPQQMDIQLETDWTRAGQKVD